MSDGGQPAAAVLDMGADAGQRVEPELAQPADLGVVECRGRPGPVGVQLRSRAGVDGRGVEFDGVAQWHRHGGGGVGDREAVLADLPQLVGEVGGAGALSSEVVEPDRRVRAGEVDVGCCR